MNIKETIAIWIRSARKGAGLSGAELGTKLALELGTKTGHSKANISHWELMRHEPSIQQLLAISKITGRSLPKEISDTLQFQSKKIIAAVEEEGIEYNAGSEQKLPQGRFVAIVGIGQGGPDGFISIDDHSPGDGDGAIYTYSPDPTAYAIRVRGDSMRPRIKSGEYIVAEPEISPQPGDDVVVKRKDGKALVKELLWIRDDEISLGSINNGIPPVTMPLSEIASVHRVAAIIPRGSALVKSWKDG